MSVMTKAFPCVGDTYTNQADVSANYGALDTMRALYYATGDLDMWLKFDLNELIVAGVKTVQSATLKIYYYLGDIPKRIQQLELYPVTSDWDEMGLTYATRPTWRTPNVGLLRSPSTANNGYGWREADVTGVVNEWLSGTLPNYGLRADNSGVEQPGSPSAGDWNNQAYYTREMGPAFSPYLEMTFDFTPTIGYALEQLDNQRKALAANLTAKGVQASASETLAQLVPKILQIPQEGGGTLPPSIRSHTIRQASTRPATATIPADAVTGDLLLIYYHGNYDTLAGSSPAGWSILKRAEGTYINATLFYKVCTADDIGQTVSIALNPNSNEPWILCCLAVSNVKGISESVILRQTSTTSTTQTVSSRIGDLVLIFAGVRASSRLLSCNVGQEVLNQVTAVESIGAWFLQADAFTESGTVTASGSNSGMTMAMVALSG